MNGFMRIIRGMSCLAWTALVVPGLAMLPSPAGATPPETCACGGIRPIPYQVLYQQRDGAWLVPTLRPIRSARQWEAAMDEWQAKQQIVGREPAPAVDWNRTAVIILAIGTQVRQLGVAVKGCHLESELTVLDLHFDLGSGQWDPIGTVEHPCIVIAIDRSHLKELALHCDANVDGLPPGMDRRSEVANGQNHLNATPATAVAAGPEATSWGRLKALYRGSAAD